MKTILATLLAPLAGVIVFHIIHVSVVVFPLHSDIDRVIGSFMLGVTPVLMVYVFLTIFSAPLFIIMFRYFGKTLKTSLITSSSFIFSLVCLFLISEYYEEVSDSIGLSFILGILAGTFTYGYAFWIISKNKGDVTIN